MNEKGDDNALKNRCRAQGGSLLQPATSMVVHGLREIGEIQAFMHACRLQQKTPHPKNALQTQRLNPARGAGTKKSHDTPSRVQAVPKAFVASLNGKII